jgi:uncharacterized protein YggU (UPF0235/DUF167 family)
MIALEPHAEGTILPVRAQPGARRNEIRGEQDGMLKVCVTQVAEKGKANKALTEVLAKSLSLRKSQLDLLSGETSSQKRFLVRGVQPAELAAAIARALDDSP